MSVLVAGRSWLAGRAPRERALVLAVAGAAALGLALLVAGAVRDDLAARRGRVEAAMRELARIRALAAEIAATPAAGDPVAAGSLLTRLETTADAVVGRQRIAGMAPVAGGRTAGGLREEGVTLRLAGASLDETVRLLHTLGEASPPLGVSRLDLQKHPDDGRRFDVVLEIRTLVRDTQPGVPR
ncbi:MAG: hypothetical protein KIT14_24175 [bacterium]|nr:hypothetical protein [bacterium]